MYYAIYGRNGRRHYLGRYPEAFLCQVALVLQCVSYLTLWTSGQLLQRRRNAWRSNHICNNNLSFWHVSFLRYSIFPQSLAIQAWPNKDFLIFQNTWRVSWIFCSDFPRLAIVLSGWHSHFFWFFGKTTFVIRRKSEDLLIHLILTLHLFSSG